MNGKKVPWIEINYIISRLKSFLFKMMPQFDIFSFFSQLFWVLIGFSYIYLSLCFYILPAFAATLKVRAKKLGVVNTKTQSLEVSTKPDLNSTFFESIASKLSVSFYSDTNSANMSYNFLMIKNEAFLKFNFSLLNSFKKICFFC
jgi:hypothetical protein